MRGLLIFVLALPSAGLAQAGNDIAVTLGLGAESAPAYFGSGTNETGPAFSFDRLTFGDGGVDRDATGLRFRPSVRYIAPREADDHAELQGLADIDAALELGGGFRYVGADFDAFAVARFGVGGHEGLVVALGADFIADLGPRWQLRAGPRALWGNEEYAQTYFGVSAAESATSVFDAYDAGSGLISAGIESRLTYQFTPDWGLSGTIAFDQLQGDAADSPIVQDKDQITAGLVLTRRVSFSF